MSTTINPLQPVAAPCPDWCDQRADHTSWDDDADGYPVRFHEHEIGFATAEPIGQMPQFAVLVTLLSAERAGAQPGEPRVCIYTDDGQVVLSPPAAMALAAHLTAAVAQLAAMGVTL